MLVENMEGDLLLQGSYRVGRSLRQRQHSTTHLGQQLASGTEVVIKTIAADSLPDNVRRRLGYEADALAQLESPRISPLLELQQDGDRIHLISRFVEGLPLAQRLAQAGGLPAEEALLMGRCLLEALQVAHGQGVLHRDIKPSNVILTSGAQRSAGAVLVDFGLSAADRLHGSIREVQPTAVSYLAPEQAGLLKQEVDERSDLYAAGALLYEVLAGAPPFCGESVGEVLLQHINVVPAGLRASGVQLPRAFEELVLHLLQKQPRDRYQTARAAAEDLVTIQRAAIRGDHEPSLVVGLSDRRGVLTEPAFIGRKEELARLERALVGVRLGEGGLVLLEGEVGAGKTRLLDELAQRAALSGALVLRGHGQGGRRRPFQHFEGVIDDLDRLADGALARRMCRSLQVQRDDLCRALPRLEQLLGPALRPEEEQQTHGAARTAVVLGALLDVLGDAERPAVVLLEDCQWADRATRQALRTWTIGRSSGAQRHVLVIASCRPGAEGHGFQGEGLRPQLHIELPSLPDDDIRAMLRSMGGELPEEVVEALSRLSRGNPLIGTSALRGLVEAGELIGGPQGWRLSADALARVQSSRRMASLLLERLQRLSGPLRELLVAGAILGAAFELDHAAQLAGQHPSITTALLKEARRRHLIWGDASGTRWRFMHDRLHQSLLQTVAPTRRQQLHLQAAKLLVEHGDGLDYEVAYHFDAAGASERALPYAVRAGRRAHARYALEVAEAQYRIAQRGLSAATSEQRLQVIEALGEVLTLRNQPEEAAQMLRQALGMAAGEAQVQARIQGKIGQLAFTRGGNQEASEALEEALRLLGRPVPAGQVASAGRLLKELAAQSLQRVFVGASRGEEADATEALALKLHTQLSAVYWYQRGPLKALWSHLHRLNRAERLPPSRELSVALAFHGRLLGELGFIEPGLRAVARALAICEQIDDVWGRGHAMYTQGSLLYLAARFDPAIQKLEQSLPLLERAGDNWQALIALELVGLSHHRRGRLLQAQELGRYILEQGQVLEHGPVTTAGLYLWGLASAGRVPEEQIARELSAAGDDLQRQLLVRQVEALHELRQGRYARAADLLEAIWSQAKQRGFKREHIFPALCWRITALRLTAQRDPDQRARLLLTARQAAREAVRIGQRHPIHLPHALRERGLLAVAQGRVSQARRDLEQSLSVADAQGARYEHAQTLLAQARVGRGLSWPGAAQQESSALDALAELGADSALGERLERRASAGATPTPLSLADRFDQVLRVGREIAGSLSTEMVFAAVREAALTLLRGERCLILEAPALSVVAGDRGVAFSTTLVREALTSGAAVTAGLPEVEGSESMVLTGIRSALAAPIFQRDAIRYCLYVTHLRVGGLFGEEEERLAGFITTLAGAALENAGAFDALNEAHRDLKATQGQLVQAGKLSALGQLGAGIAHELNQPIQSIQGFAQRIRRHGQALVVDHADELDIIINATHRMASIVQNIRHFARDSASSLQPMDPVQPVQDALALLQRQLQEHGVEVIERMPDAPLPEIQGDPVKLQQVYLNLILNARDALDEATAKQITIEARHDAEEALVLIRVADTGPGVAQEDVGRVFDPFFTTKDAGKGTGLGLSISYGIVKEHGGELDYQDRVGGGAVFLVRLPTKPAKK